MPLGARVPFVRGGEGGQIKLSNRTGMDDGDSIEKQLAVLEAERGAGQEGRTECFKSKII